MIGCRQSGAVDKMGIAQAETPGVIVHQCDKCLFTAGDEFGQGHAGIVAGLDDHALEQLFHRNIGIDLDKHA